LRANGIGAPIISIEPPNESDLAGAGRALTVAGRGEIARVLVWLNMAVSPNFDGPR
jgi:hypothetical protein